MVGGKLAFALGAVVAGFAVGSSSAAAVVTIGPDVNQFPLTSGTCAYNDAGDRPCVTVTTALPAGRNLTAPCTGTIVRFRLNGIPRPLNTYRLRVIRKNQDGSYTGTASSEPVGILADGPNEYTTNLPIAAGEYIGLDFQGSTEELSIRWVGTFPAASQLVFRPFPADGVAAPAGGPDTAYYLFNADVQCVGEGGGGAPPPVGPPSNAFEVVSLKGKKLTLSLASAGAVTAANPKIAKKAKGKAKPKLLKTSSASGGPGLVTVPLKLTGAANAKLREKGKVKVKAVLSFTPSGGATATQTKTFTVKQPKKAAK